VFLFFCFCRVRGGPLPHALFSHPLPHAFHKLLRRCTPCTHTCLLARLPSPFPTLSLSPLALPFPCVCVCVWCVACVCVGCFRGNFLAWVVLSCVCTCMHACEWSVVVVV
jgi:hypothetical protein